MRLNLKKSIFFNDFGKLKVCEKILIILAKK